jgi:hypothetical protein
MTTTPGSYTRTHMRLAVEVLATGSGPVHARLQAALPHYGVVHQSEMRTPAEVRTQLRGVRGALRILSVDRKEFDGDRAYRLLHAASSDTIVEPIKRELVSIRRIR